MCDIWELVSENFSQPFLPILRESFNPIDRRQENEIRLFFLLDCHSLESSYFYITQVPSTISLIHLQILVRDYHYLSSINNYYSFDN